MAELERTRRIEHPDRTIDTFVAKALTADFEITLPMYGYDHVSLFWDTIVAHVGTTESADWYGKTSPPGVAPEEWTAIRAHDVSAAVSLGTNPFGSAEGVYYFSPVAIGTTTIGVTHPVGLWFAEFQFAWTAGDTSAGIVNFAVQRIKTNRGS